MDALDSILNWLEAQKERYVILSDSYIAMNFDFNKLIDAHVKSGADVTVAPGESIELTRDAQGRLALQLTRG